jgi:YD repeat-containing protein
MKTSSLTFSRESSLFQKGIAVLLTAFMGCASSALAADPTFGPVSVQTSYDGNGNATGRTDGNGAQTITTYDAMNRVTGIDLTPDKVEQ